jgi:hypothetical protein
MEAHSDEERKAALQEAEVLRKLDISFIAT